MNASDFSDELTPELQTQDPEPDPELQALLKQVQATPPEGYFEAFWQELQPQLQTIMPSVPLHLRLLRSLKTPPVLTAAAAVLVIALLLPIGLRQNQSSPPQAPLAEEQQAKSLPEGSQIAARRDLGLEKEAMLPPAPLVLGAGQPENKATRTDNSLETPSAELDNEGPIQQAELQLDVTELATSLGRIEQLTQAQGGYSVTSELSQPETGPAVAQMRLKVPAGQLQALLAQIEQQGTLRHKQLKSEDRETQANTWDPQPNASTEPEQTTPENPNTQTVFSTISLQLTQKTAVGFWDQAQTLTLIKARFNQILSETLRLTFNLFSLLPALLIYFGCAWLLWKLLYLGLIARMQLLAPQTLAIAYLLGLLFFPLLAGEQALFRVTLLIGMLMGGSIGVRHLMRQRKPEARESESD